MLRLSEVRLPFNHAEEELHAEICRLMRIPEDVLLRYTVFRRGVDARKSHAIVFVYTVDFEVADEPRLLSSFKNYPRLKPTPDMSYPFVARVPETMQAPRPVIIGMGPAGLFAGLILAQDGW